MLALPTTHPNMSYRDNLIVFSATPYPIDDVNSRPSESVESREHSLFDGNSHVTTPATTASPLSDATDDAGDDHHHDAPTATTPDLKKVHLIGSPDGRTYWPGIDCTGNVVCLRTRAILDAIEACQQHTDAVSS